MTSKRELHQKVIVVPNKKKVDKRFYFLKMIIVMISYHIDHRPERLERLCLVQNANKKRLRLHVHFGKMCFLQSGMILMSDSDLFSMSSNRYSYIINKLNITMKIFDFSIFA